MMDTLMGSLAITRYTWPKHNNDKTYMGQLNPFVSGCTAGINH